MKRKCDCCLHKTVCEQGGLTLEPCGHFKDENLFLEIAAPIGSTVYEVFVDEIPQLDIYISEFDLQDVSAKEIKYADDWTSKDYIGTDVFFNKKAAEKRKAELEKIYAK